MSTTDVPQTTKTDIDEIIAQVGMCDDDPNLLIEAGAVRQLCAEIERLRAALKGIVEHWGDPMPIGTPPRDLMKMWQRNYLDLKKLARNGLGDD